ncbi:MAG: hypothetical protein KC933_07880 [Myxococcales bacterium]|nr:hypothetical protein [Myxococcales bacterium]
MQAALLRAVAEAHDTPSVGPFARFGEPTPGHMLHRLMEGMVPEDRARALDALEGSGVLTEAGAARLRAGRSTAGRLAPWLTHGAHLATEDYARWSQEEGGGLYAFAGGLAVLGTEPLVADTVLTLGSAGAGPWAAKLLAARFPLTATALGAAGTGLAAYQATVDLQAVLTGQDPYTGKPLGPGETLSRVVRAGSGVLLTATGMIAAFQAGKIGPPPRDAVGGPRQATAADLADLTTHYAPVDVPGLPLGMQGWVPRRLPVVARAPVSPGAPGPAPVAVGPVGALTEAARLGLPAPPKTPQLAPGAVAAAEVEQEAASLAGNVAGELMKPHRFGADEGAVQAALRQSARETAQTTYLTGRTQGMTPKQARNAALRAARDALGPEVARHAEATALRELETRVADGRVFDRAIMDPRARAVLEAFERGQIGAGAKAWAVRLAGKSERQVRALMKLEVQAGRATERAVALTAPKAQTMSVWEMPDGTVVRVKPLGDAGRAGPTLSVEVKVDPGIPDANQSGIAFKLDARGRPVPKNMNEANQPFAVHGDQGAVYNRACMDLGHQSIKP